ncbi:MAG: ankyrin repeat domain-containing protein [Bacteroidales bacterium]|nr:ankyrin repeat domain-containing protein [Bacteroidales bacterium]
MRSFISTVFFLLITMLAGRHATFAQESDTVSLFFPVTSYLIDTSYFTKESDGFNLILAAERGNITALEILLRRDADVTETTYDGVTALMYCSAAGDLEAVELLLAHGADVNKVPVNGMTALIGAVRAGSYGVAELLLENGADPDHIDDDGLNSLMYATAYNFDDIVDLLLFYGVDISHEDYFKADALIIGAYYGSFESVKLLIDYGADVETTDKNGFTPLMVASQEGHYELVWLLINEGSDIHVKNLGGYDALSLAIQYGRKDIAELLIDNGADVNATHAGTENVIDIAKEEEDDEIIEMLKQKGARRNFFPNLSAVTGGFDINFNTDDVMIGPGFGIIDNKYGLELFSQFLIRPVRIRVLEEEGDELAWQFWERRFLLSASLNKNFKLFNTGKAQIGLSPGVGVGYTWGSFRGSDRHPQPRTFFMPNAGIYYQAEGFVYNFSYQYADKKVIDISPHHFNLSFRFIIDVRNEKYRKKEISWF